MTMHSDNYYTYVGKIIQCVLIMDALIWFIGLLQRPKHISSQYAPW